MKHIEKFIESFDQTIKDLYSNEINQYGTNPVVKINGVDCLMFASNNYLSLSNDARVIDSAIGALKSNGLGPGGSRFLCGNINILNDLEKHISKFIGVEDCITFPTGYMANLSAPSALVGSFMNNQPHDVKEAIIFSDEHNHGTIVDGIKISGAKKIVYPHLDYSFLEDELNKNQKVHPKLIITESVYPMDGDIADLNKIHDLAKKYDAIMMVDDAHGVGVLGEKGSGALEYFNLYGKVDLIMGSMDKAIGCMGGYLGGNKKLIQYLRIASRPYIFSSSVPAVLAGGIIESIKICQSESFRRKEIIEKSKYLRDKLESIGYEILGNSSNLPVVTILIGSNEECNNLSKYLFKNNIFLPSIVWPAVAMNTARLRITIMRDHTMEQLDYLISILNKFKNSN